MDEYIEIGVALNTNEIRRIIGVSGNVLTLDYPTAFPHANGEDCNEVAAAFSGGTNYITFVPGAWETITVADMVPEIVPQYFLGTSSNRNFYIAYRGRQTFTGSLPNVILLNGVPLRFPIGTVATTGTDVGGGGGSTLNGATLKGALTIVVADGVDYDNNDFIQIDTGTTAEVRQIVSGAGANGLNETFVLNYPLMQAHATGVTLNEVTSTYTHTISEATELDSVTWHLTQRDSAETTANDLTRRYVGGMVNRMTLSAEEAGMLRVSWDDVQFLDEVHNQQFHSAVGGGTTEVDRFNGAITVPTPSFPTNEPYYFSQSSLSLFGVEFARVRNFRLEVNNNVAPRYYLRDDTHGRAPQEIQEQRREYRLTATIALPDSLASTATTRTLFKELLQEGNYTAGLTGFDMTLTFTRTASTDTLTITAPPSSAVAGGDAQGCFFGRVQINTGTESPLSAEVEIIVRSLSCVIVDSTAVYP